ncbi:MAG: MurR/RpiR family transcriptional regulator [Spirochaetia bacterium]|nr:MurR/RpiR family transcriptional regulator [Spirochaetia bacterium]NCC91072.1 MurR/RpiR family transcriptional regulator [Spirochaetia bacterium]
MEEVSAIYTIQSKYESLSVKEKKIADFILKHPKESVNPSIEELAEMIGISESTMVRFARKLGYAGYQRFRIALARETIPSNEQVFEIGVSDQEDPIDTVFKNAQDTLSETYKRISRDALHQVGKQFSEARNIYLVGLGGSNIIALDAYHKLIRTGLNCNYATDYHMQLMLASQSSEEDIALIISHTGSGYDTLAIAEEFRNNRCPLAVLTSNSRSPLAKMAQHLLHVSTSSRQMVAESFSARIVSLTVIDILYVEVLEQMKNQGVENLNKMRNVIAKRRI